MTEEEKQAMLREFNEENADSDGEDDEESAQYSDEEKHSIDGDEGDDGDRDGNVPAEAELSGAERSELTADGGRNDEIDTVPDPTNNADMEDDCPDKHHQGIDTVSGSRKNYQRIINDDDEVGGSEGDLIESSTDNRVDGSPNIDQMEDSAPVAKQKTSKSRNSEYRRMLEEEERRYRKEKVLHLYAPID
jgi:hypothetical protein